MEKVRNGTAESAQSTPTHPWPMEARPRKLFVHAERLASCPSERLGTRLAERSAYAGNGWKADYSIPAHTRTKRDVPAQHDDDA